MPDTPDTPPEPAVPAWLLDDAALVEPETYRLEVSLPAERYRQLLALARGDAAQAEQVGAALLAAAIADDPADLREALDDTDRELHAAEARCTELAQELQADRTALQAMTRQRDAALSVINKALGARRGAEAELRAIKQAMEGQSDG